MTSNRAEIAGKLCKEISIITRTDLRKIDAEQSLYDNGIDSMSFLELLMFIKNEWGIDYIDAEMPPDAQRRITALAGHIAVVLEKK